ncbi:MAG: serine/threonine-protein kinase [Thermoleophilaceae bacterium]
MTALAAGSTVCDGRYRLDEVLGRGGMAIVWAATDLQLERRVAIKLISDVLATDPRFVARFEREARLAAGLTHPNLVKVFDYSAEGDRPLLVMELVPGGTLAGARGSVDDPVALARDLLDALAHIHAAGILHRDIKPANVLLDANGSPRLTDFGIARGEEQTGLTLTGQIMGTLRYIAPEVAAGEPSSRRSDLYSLGVLLAEVAGEPPPEPLARLLPRLTAAEPAARPESAAAALSELTPTRALGQAAAAAPASAPAPTRALPNERFVPRTRPRRRPGWTARPPLLPVVLLVVVAAVVAIAGGGGGSVSPGTTSTKKAAPATVPRPAPAGAALDRQLTQLERIVRAAPRRR